MCVANYSTLRRFLLKWLDGSTLRFERRSPPGRARRQDEVNRRAGRKREREERRRERMSSLENAPEKKTKREDFPNLIELSRRSRPGGPFAGWPSLFADLPAFFLGQNSTPLNRCSEAGGKILMAPLKDGRAREYSEWGVGLLSGQKETATDNYCMYDYSRWVQQYRSTFAQTSSTLLSIEIERVI